MVEAKYTDSADLRITKSILENDAEPETYLESNLDLGEFSMTASLYNNSGLEQQWSRGERVIPIAAGRLWRPRRRDRG
ncbi:MAG: hypothetical protein ACLFPW_12965, partial [Spirochaetaceae bacterium]